MTDAFTTPTQVSKSEMVYRTLLGRITAGQYVNGYRIVMDQIAKELGVSSPPVREAVRRLEAEGLIRFTPNVGAEVAGINSADYADTMQVLAYLESAATSLAVPHFTEEALAKAAEINRAMWRLQEHDFDPVHFTELNEQFHKTLCSACPNAHLLSLLNREWRRMSTIRRSSFTFMPSRSAASVIEHDHILELIRSGAPVDEIERATRNHKLRTVNEYLDARAKRTAVSAPST